MRGGEELSNNTRIAAFASEILVVDPAVGFLKSGAERSVGFPVKQLLNSRVVGVASVYALWRAQVIFALQLDARNFFHDVHQLVHGHGFAGAKIDRIENPGVHDEIDSLHAIVNVHEAPGLFATAPDFDFVFAAELRFDDFSADCGRRLFAAPVPGAPPATDLLK